MEIYLKVVKALEVYFNQPGWKNLFLQGGCYWFADYLSHMINGSVIMINRIEEHCALWFDGGLYDVRGRISKKYFVVAGEREISFMKKNYIPKFDTILVEEYLENVLLY